MPTPELVDAGEVIEILGVPFDPIRFAAATAAVRAEAGWHIAPVITETLTVTSYGGQLLTLPTRRIVTISAVRDSAGVVLTDWMKLPTAIYRSTGWPIDVLSVDLTHGYDEAPADLLPIVAQRMTAAMVGANVSQRSTTAGPFGESETYSDGSMRDPVVTRYAVIPGIA